MKDGEAPEELAQPMLEPGYLFSQHSLNTYVRCPRRFWLKYVERQPWPMSEETDPLAYQAHLARGRTFHQWLARTALGMDMGPIAAACGDTQLQAWWRAAQEDGLADLPAGLREAELPLVVALGSYRLYARFDLLALDTGGEAVVVDWKTLAYLPTPRVLRQRIQTRVYLYALVTAGHVLTGGAPIDPARTSMVYWFASFPDQPATVSYSRQAYQQDARYLLDLVHRIAHQPREGFGLAEDPRECMRCNYRSLCGRAESDAAPQGAAQDWLDEDIDFDLELDQAPELDY